MLATRGGNHEKTDRQADHGLERLHEPGPFHTHIRLDNGTEPRLKLSGFSYFGEIGGLRHLPVGPGADGSVVLFPEH